MNMEILTNREYHYQYVLSHRFSCSYQEMEHHSKLIENSLEKYGLARGNVSLSSTYSVNVINNEHIIDMEVLIPVDKYLPIEDESLIIKEFLVKNAVVVNVVGREQLSDGLNHLTKYINDEQMTMITPAYTVTPYSESINLKEVTLEIFIGVSPNKL